MSPYKVRVQLVLAGMLNSIFNSAPKVPFCKCLPIYHIFFEMCGDLFHLAHGWRGNDYRNEAKTGKVYQP